MLPAGRLTSSSVPSGLLFRCNSFIMCSNEIIFKEELEKQVATTHVRVSSPLKRVTFKTVFGILTLIFAKKKLFLHRTDIIYTYRMLDDLVSDRLFILKCWTVFCVLVANTMRLFLRSAPIVSSRDRSPRIYVTQI